jgi:hypothetical protein
MTCSRLLALSAAFLTVSVTVVIGSSPEWLPRGEAFAPPLADPKQPRFRASLLRYDLPRFGTIDAAAIAIGDHIGIARGDSGRGTEWQAGITAGVFALFNLDGTSEDLLNADYVVGPTLAVRRGGVAIRLRLFHQSSHLGDELLVLPQPIEIERIELAYEALEALAAWEREPLRLYGGATRIVHTVSGLEPNILQAGAELRGRRWQVAPVRLVAAVALESWEQHDWEVDRNVEVGVAIGAPPGEGRSLRLTLQWRRGRVPYGQFAAFGGEWVGIGLAFGS